MTALTMSVAKLRWWGEAWTMEPIEQPRIAVLQHVVNTTPRPTNPTEVIACGYLNSAKLHDGEPELVVRLMEEFRPGFFDSYPVKRGTVVDARKKKMIVGEALTEFLPPGEPGYHFPKRGAR